MQPYHLIKPSPKTPYLLSLHSLSFLSEMWLASRDPVPLSFERFSDKILDDWVLERVILGPVKPRLRQSIGFFDVLIFIAVRKDGVVYAPPPMYQTANR